jgi:hypothetical protein
MTGPGFQARHRIVTLPFQTLFEGEPPRLPEALPLNVLPLSKSPGMPIFSDVFC